MKLVGNQSFLIESDPCRYDIKYLNKALNKSYQKLKAFRFNARSFYEKYRIFIIYFVINTLLPEKVQNITFFQLYMFNSLF